MTFRVENNSAVNPSGSLGTDVALLTGNSQGTSNLGGTGDSFDTAGGTVFDGLSTDGELVAQGTRQAPSLDDIRAGRGMLTLGSTGDSVVELHDRLSAMGFEVGNGNPRVYSQQTADAVEAFQRAYRVSVNGDVGRTTLERLDQVDGGGNYGGVRLFPEGVVGAPHYPTAYTWAGVPHYMEATGGFMEPHHSHSPKSASLAIFGDDPDNAVQLPAARRNLGIDYTTSDGDIRPWWGGQVTQVSWEGSYGNRIHVQTDITYRYKGQDYRVMTAYAHADSFDPNLRVGSRVERGQDIGDMGGTGGNYGAHVDLRIWIDTPEGRIDLSPNAIQNQRLSRGLPL